MTREKAREILQQHGITDQVAILGYRSAKSQYGEYDDIGALYTPADYIEFKYNTLPSKWASNIAKLLPGVYRYRKGLHGIHHLDLTQRKDGSYVCQEDKEIYDWLIAHPGKDHPHILVGGKARILPYWAYRQAGPVTIIRHGATVPETKVNPAEWPFIDLHKGGWNLTSSAGCQTFYPDHWEDARALGYEAMDKNGQKEVLYCLVQL